MFNAEAAIKRAHLAQYAYEDWDSCRRHVASMGLSCFQGFENGENQAYVAANDGKIYVVFRGTDSFSDWLTDVRFCKVPLDQVHFPGVKVHRGFLLATAAIGEEVSNHVLTLLQRLKRPVEVIGHSLGAAMGAIWAFLSDHSDLPIYAVWTFGAPRVGNRRWAKEYAWSSLGSRTYRVTNSADPVAVVPKIGYRPVGRHFHINRNGSIVENPHPLRYFADRWIARGLAVWNRKSLFGVAKQLVVDFHTLQAGYIPALEGLSA